MKSYLKIPFVFIISFFFLLISCESSFDSLVDQRLENNPPPEQPNGEPGDADFSNYIAIGNSMTAGYMDGALYNEGQQWSFPALIAENLKYAGAPESFNQPDINSERGYNTTVTQPGGGTILGRYKLDTSIPGPSPTIGGDPIGAYNGDTGSLDNFGVPGIVVGQLLTAATGGPQSDPAFNPFYARFASSPGSSTILGDVIAAQPTFFTLWIGSNDVLGYATSGGANPALLTSEQDFENYFNTIINQLMSNTSAKGVVATIPPVTAIPFFQAVTYDAINLTSDKATQLNTSLASINQALQAVADNFPEHSQEEMNARMINYQEGANPILANDPELDDLEDEFDALGFSAEQRQALVPYEQSRPLTEDELVTLSAGSVLGTEYNPQSPTPTTIGVIIPLGFDSQKSAFGDAYYLTVAEQGQIQSRSTAFNQTIAATVAQNSNRLALFDVNSGFPGNPNTEIGALADLLGMDGEIGINIGSTELQPDFSPNGVFSTDGIHMNPRGSAILANEFIKVMENEFNASIPRVDILNLPSVQLCAGNCVSQQGKRAARNTTGLLSIN